MTPLLQSIILRSDRLGLSLTSLMYMQGAEEEEKEEEDDLFADDDAAEAKVSSTASPINPTKAPWGKA